MLGCLLFTSVTVTVFSRRKRKCTRVIQDVLLLEERKLDLLLKLLSFLSLLCEIINCWLLLIQFWYPNDQYWFLYPIYTHSLCTQKHNGEGVCVLEGLLLYEEEVIMSIPNTVNCKPGKVSRHTAIKKFKKIKKALTCIRLRRKQQSVFNDAGQCRTAINNTRRV